MESARNWSGRENAGRPDGAEKIRLARSPLGDREGQERRDGKVEEPWRHIAPGDEAACLCDCQKQEYGVQRKEIRPVRRKLAEIEGVHVPRDHIQPERSV